MDQLLVGPQAKALHPAADREHHVGGVEDRTHPAVDPHRADRQRVPVVDRALALAGGDDRRLQRFRDGPQRVRGVAEHHPAAGHDQRRRRGGEQARPRVRCPQALAATGSPAPQPAAAVTVVGSAKASGGTSISVGRGRPERHLPERLVHPGGDPVRGQHPLGPLGDRSHEVELVVHVVQQTEVAPDAVAG